MTPRWESSSVCLWHHSDRTGWTLHVRPLSAAELAATDGPGRCGWLAGVLFVMWVLS